MGTSPDEGKQRGGAVRDEAWYRGVYEEHAADVLAYLRRRTDAGAAHDLLSDVFLVAWRRRAVIPEPALRRAWLLRVASNVLRNQRRSEARRHRLISRLAWQPAGTASEHADEVIEDVVLRNAMTRLRPSDREILRLAVWEECSMAELGAILRCSPNAAALRLHRARGRLRHMLTAEERASATPRARGGAKRTNLRHTEVEK